MEKFWHGALAPLRDHPRVNDVRICGTIAAVEIATPGGYLAQVGPALRRVCLERGVLLRPLGNVLYALPPLCTSETSLQQIAAAMITAVDKASRRVSVSIKALEMKDEQEAIEQFGSSDSGASLGDILGAALKNAGSKE